MHRFPRADKDPQFQTGDKYDVSHLASYHMHYFQFKVWIEVTHNDRDIEFIQLRRWLESLYSEGTLQADDKSCEMLADDLISAITNQYGVMRKVIVDVAEDGINGAVVEHEGVQ